MNYYYKIKEWIFMDAYDIEIRDKVDELVRFINIEFHMDELPPKEQSDGCDDMADRIQEISHDILFYCIFEYFGYDFDDTKDLIIKGVKNDE